MSGLPELFNETPWIVEGYPMLDAEGADITLVVVKATFSMGSRRGLEPHTDPHPIRAGDEMWGDAEIPDVRYPGDLSPAKKGTDVVIVGHAIARDAKPRESIDVQFNVAGRKMALRAHGPRVWKSGLTGLSPGRAEPVDRVPLAWGLAFGGQDFSNPKKPLEHPRNPVGRGMAHSQKTLLKRPAPQIEDRRHPVTNASRSNHPAGCAAIGRSFEPRRGFAGTYDDPWLQNRFPARPKDYEVEHENCAAPGLVFETPLRGGEPIRLEGIRVGGPLEFELPSFRVVIEHEGPQGHSPIRPELDTVLMDTDGPLIEMVWRAAFPRVAEHVSKSRIRVSHKVPV